jgi:YHS domain-containing protein
VRFLIWLLLIYLAYRMIRGKRAPQLKKQPQQVTEFLLDPVCGVYVSEADAVVGNLEGRRYHFCSMACLKTFERQQQQRQHQTQAEE